MSIQPKWCELIASGKKTVEVRKTKPKAETPFKVYIYCTISGGAKGDRLVPSEIACGKVIGEFVCNSIQEYESEFVDDDCREAIASIDRDEDGDITGFYEWTNEMDIPYIKTDFFKKCCVGYKDLKKYIGLGFVTFYGWHISDLVIYDKPKELSEFYNLCYSGCDNCKYQSLDYSYAGGKDFICTISNRKPMKRPPQSWCYVEERETNG